MKNNNGIYDVINQEGKIICSGSCTEIAKKYHTSVSTIRTRARNSYVIDGLSFVKRNGESHNENLSYLKTNLLIYGNTVFSENILDYINELKNYGINIIYEKKKDIIDGKNYYYVEVAL